MFLFDNQLIREDNYSKPQWRPRTAPCRAGTEWQPELLSVTSASRRKRRFPSLGKDEKNPNSPPKIKGSADPKEKVSAAVLDGSLGHFASKKRHAIRREEMKRAAKVSRRRAEGLSLFSKKPKRSHSFQMRCSKEGSNEWTSASTADRARGNRLKL